MTNPEKLVRQNILSLKPYSSARDEFTGKGVVYLDANENPFNEPYNRYPDPHQRELKKVIAEIKGIDTERIFAGNGSDEPIDLLIRAFCEPGKDNLIIPDPTYGMYHVAAQINNIVVKKIPLTTEFRLNPDNLLGKTDGNSKLVFLCSPNNPTGNNLGTSAIRHVISRFPGIVVLDEAYIDFSPGDSLLPELNRYPNLVILHTFSKAWGMAGLRLGVAFASPFIVSVLEKIKYPYNISALTQQKAVELLKNREAREVWTARILKERCRMREELGKLPFVTRVYHSDANFLLVKMHDPVKIYRYLTAQGIVVRDRSGIFLCEGSLRITIGTEQENDVLLDALNNYL